ncbi:hypothetical protein GCM10027072_74120 [Streptomyces bullii]
MLDVGGLSGGLAAHGGGGRIISIGSVFADLPEFRDATGATCLYAVYDPVARQCAVASAGHPPPVVVGADGTEQAIPISPGPPLGVGGMPFEITSVTLEPDSRLRRMPRQRLALSC